MLTCSIIEVQQNGDVRLVIADESQLSKLLSSSQLIKGRAVSENSSTTASSQRVIYLNEKTRTATLFLVVTIKEDGGGETYAVLSLNIPIPDHLWPSLTTTTTTSTMLLTSALYAQAFMSNFVLGVVLGFSILLLIILIFGLIWYADTGARFHIAWNIANGLFSR